MTDRENLRDTPDHLEQMQEAKEKFDLVIDNLLASAKEAGNARSLLHSAIQSAQMSLDSEVTEIARAQHSLLNTRFENALNELELVIKAWPPIRDS